jgi:DNA (cytosine-5)-methyltransferase 1
MRLKIIDLFSGCGGSALGFKQAGFEIKAAVDINEAASKTFKKNFPETNVITADVTTISGNDLLKAAGVLDGNDLVLLGCPPCQGFSTARRNSQRLSEPRNNLIKDFVRLVKEIKPTYFVMENVPGLAKRIGSSLFTEAVRDLSTAGYEVIFDIFDTADFGVPQRRKRLVMMGTRDKNIRLTFPKKTNEDPLKGSGALPNWITVRSVIENLPKISAGEKDKRDGMHVSANLSETNFNRMKSTPANGGGRDSWKDELILDCHRDKKGFKDVYGRMRWDYPSPTITGGCAMISKGRFGHPEQHRAISLREAARLQTFPDNFVFEGNFGQIADQIGNAVPVLLTKRIGDALMETIKESEKLDEILKSGTDLNFTGINDSANPQESSFGIA